MITVQPVLCVCVCVCVCVTVCVCACMCMHSCTVCTKNLKDVQPQVKIEIEIAQDGSLAHREKNNKGTEDLGRESMEVLTFVLGTLFKVLTPSL